MALSDYAVGTNNAVQRILARRLAAELQAKKDAQEQFNNERLLKADARAQQQLDATIEQNRLTREASQRYQDAQIANMEEGRAAQRREDLSPGTFVESSNPNIARWSKYGINVGTPVEAAQGMGKDFVGPMNTGETPEAAQQSHGGGFILSATRAQRDKQTELDAKAEAEQRLQDRADQQARHEKAMEDIARIQATRPTGGGLVVVNTKDGPMVANKGAGTVTPLLGGDGKQVGPAPTATQRDKATAYEVAEPIINDIAELSERINVNQGAFATISGTVERAKAEANLNDDVAEYEAMVDSFAPLVARAMGHTGVLTQQDVDSAKSIFPAPKDSKSLRDRKVVRMKRIMGNVKNVVEGKAGSMAAPDGGDAPPSNASTDSSQTTPPKKRVRYDINGRPIKD